MSRDLGGVWSCATGSILDGRPYGVSGDIHTSNQPLGVENVIDLPAITPQPDMNLRKRGCRSEPLLRQRH